MYQYIKALHIIFVITWFSGLFYVVRLFIYNTEANEKNEIEKNILQNQFKIMIKRLWYGITWPSAILTLLFGSWLFIIYGWADWLLFKIAFLFLLYLYHFSLHVIYKQQSKKVFKYSSNQLRIWNEIATLFLVSIVMIVVVKNKLSILWGIIGFIIFTLLLLIAIKIYRLIRNKN